METDTLKLPLRLNVSLKKRLISVFIGILLAPLSFLILSSPSLSLNFAGLSSSENALVIACIILFATLIYPFLTPYIVINEKGITEWSTGLIKLPWYYPWANIEAIRVVETNLPLGSSPLLPYKRKAIGIDFKQGLPIDMLSGKSDPILKKLTGPMKFFTGSQVLFNDPTNLFDKTIYGKNPEEFATMLNAWKEHFDALLT